jgi:hypothetical protein
MHDGDYFEVGQAIYFWTELKNRLKQPIDPVGLEFHIKPPGQAVIVFALLDLTHESTGRFSYIHVVDRPGLWSYAFHSDEPDDVDGDRFHVSNSSQP